MSSPAARRWISLAFDPSDSGVLLFGGLNVERGVYFGDTWLFTAAGWQNLTPSLSISPAPPPMAYYGMTYDAADGFDLLFGGAGPNGTLLAGTWTFEHGHWAEIHPRVSPPARENMGLAYDSIDGYVVLFGGLGVSGELGDTWTFHRGNWTQLNPSTAPIQRSQLAMNYDAVDSEVVLDGGFGGGSTYFTDAWGFRGGAWFPISAMPQYGARSSGDQSATDPAGGSYLLFGGYSSDYNASGTLFADTWRFSSSGWTLLNRSVVPAGRDDAGMAEDPATGMVLMFGGKGGPPGSPVSLADTWAWTSPVVSLQSSATVMDLGQSVTFTASASSPAGQERFRWSSVSPALGCPAGSGPVMTCTPSSVGTYSATLNVTDGAGASTNQTISVTVDPALTAGLVISPNASFVGELVTFNLTLGGGTAPINVTFIGLPTICGTPSSARFSCRVSSAAVFVVTAQLIDSAGATLSTSATLDVDAKLAIVSVGAAPSTAAVGGRVAVTVTTSGGVAPLSYQYFNLPSGCTSIDRSELNCTTDRSGTYLVTVNVTDAAGEWSTANVSWTVGVSSAAVGGLPPILLYVLIGAALATGAGVIGWWSVRRKRVSQDEAPQGQ